MSIYYYCQKCSGTFDPAHTQCPNCDAPDDRDAEIASLRASVERLEEVVRLRTALELAAESRAESAEATIARLAAVVRAAEEYVDSFQEEDALEAGRCYAVIVAALSSLTAEDRRRVGIEG